MLSFSHVKAHLFIQPVDRDQRPGDGIEIRTKPVLCPVCWRLPCTHKSVMSRGKCSPSVHMTQWEQGGQVCSWGGSKGKKLPAEVSDGLRRKFCRAGDPTYEGAEAGRVQGVTRVWVRGRESETRERERGLVKSVQDVSKPEPKIPFLISYK